jgi:hypothetical protein
VKEVSDRQVAWVDPRSYGSGDHPLVALATATAAGAGDAWGRLTAALRGHAVEGDDDAIEAAFASAPNQRVRSMLLEALKGAIDDPAPNANDGVLTRVFALPVLFVVGGRRDTIVPGLVPDIAAIDALLRRHGALGQTENFGLAATLVTAAALAAVKPSVLYRWTRTFEQPDAGLRSLKGADILTDDIEEQVHLRFLVGAGVAPAQGLSFVESASRIGAWGMPVSQALTAQLCQEGLSLLPLPRPPKSLLVAPAAGGFALQEARLNLFLSRGLRRLRATVGEPVAVLSVHAGGEVRMALSSPFDAAAQQGFRWLLGAFDDLGEVASVMLSLLHDCRVLDVRVVPGLQPDRDPAGAPRFLSVDDLGPSNEVRH